MKKFKVTEHMATTILAVIEDAWSEVESLTEEMEEWRDNMEGTSLENTSKFEEVSEAAEALRNGIDNKPDIPESFKEIIEGSVVSYKIISPYGKKSPSRARRLSNAVVMIDAAIEKLNDMLEHMEESEKKTELQDFVNELESAKEEIEMVDFPGMF